MVTIVGLRRSLGWRRIAARLRDSPVALTVVLVVGALVAALLEQTITVMAGGWSWVALAQSGMKDVAFALLLSGVVVISRAQRAAQTTADPSPHPEPTIDELTRELSDITDVAHELGLVPTPGHGVDSWASSFEQLDALRWSLATYVLRGDRIRRMINAPRTAGPGSAGIETSPAGRAFRTRADALAESVRYTNGVVSDWLIAHRVAVVNPCYLDSNTLFDRCRTGRLDPASISEDPLYLLVCHLRDVLDAVTDPDDARLDHVQAQLTLPLRAVHREVAAAMAFCAAAIGVTRDGAKTRLH